MMKYTSATNVHTSNERNDVATRFFAFNVKSVAAMIEIREESFISIINCDASGGNTRLNACGKIICVIAFVWDIPSERAASICPFGTP